MALKLAFCSHFQKDYFSWMKYLLKLEHGYFAKLIWNQHFLYQKILVSTSTHHISASIIVHHMSTLQASFVHPSLMYEDMHTWTCCRHNTNKSSILHTHYFKHTIKSGRLSSQHSWALFIHLHAFFTFYWHNWHNNITRIFEVFSTKKLQFSKLNRDILCCDIVLNFYPVGQMPTKSLKS